VKKITEGTEWAGKKTHRALVMKVLEIHQCHKVLNIFQLFTTNIHHRNYFKNILEPQWSPQQKARVQDSF
jgi:hypothetical protein